jgi:putative RNA 2'-phosphotransferase
MSQVLRHRPEQIGLTLDSQGWVAIDTLLTQAQAHGEPLDRATLDTVVADNDKQRFQVSDDGLRIRAVQGHSSGQVAIQRPAQRPPAVLYHGTTEKAWASIAKQGLLPGRRHQVHLSLDLATARTVGSRHGTQVVLLRVDTAALHARGHRFERAENGVWLTDTVPVWALTREP